jgi:hypothetical protein
MRRLHSPFKCLPILAITANERRPWRQLSTSTAIKARDLMALRHEPRDDRRADVASAADHANLHALQAPCHLATTAVYSRAPAHRFPTGIAFAPSGYAYAIHTVTQVSGILQAVAGFTSNAAEYSGWGAVHFEKIFMMRVLILIP